MRRRESIRQMTAEMRARQDAYSAEFARHQQITRASLQKVADTLPVVPPTLQAYLAGSDVAPVEDLSAASPDLCDAVGERSLSKREKIQKMTEEMLERQNALQARLADMEDVKRARLRHVACSLPEVPPALARYLSEPNLFRAQQRASTGTDNR